MIRSSRGAIVVGLVALATIAVTFFVGRASGSDEKTTHVRSKQEARSVVAVAQKSPRVDTISAGTLAALVAPPQAPSGSTGPSNSSGSSGSTYTPPPPVIVDDG
jgi:hypothetical protein